MLSYTFSQGIRLLENLSEEEDGMADHDERQFGTRVVWSGEERKDFWQRATQTPVVHSVTYGYRDMDEWREVALARQKGHIYSRNSNPTVAVFEEKVRDLEGAETATSFSTGMAAISNTLYALLAAGDRVVSVKDTYGGTNKIFLEFAPRADIDVALCDTTDHEAIEAEIVKGCQLLYLESPTNPTLKVIDLARLAKRIRRVRWLSWTTPSPRRSTRTHLISGRTW